MYEKIEQHMYTRTRRGLLNGTEGYDTVGMSPGLTLDFIKKQIHPYCFFSGGSGKALTVVHLPCGYMLFGQGVHKERDFTGLRSAFFQHNYLIPPWQVQGVFGDFLRVPFCEEYNGTGGLPFLDKLPLSDALPKGDASFGIWDAKDLADCIVCAVVSNKKIYFLTPTGDAHTFALSVLSGVYPFLPDTVKQVLGFCTRAGEWVNKKGIHLVFLTNNAIKSNDPHLAGHFLIDFEKKSGIIEEADATDFFVRRFSGMPAERIFVEIDFWQKRMPSVVRGDDFREAVHRRVTALLNDRLSDGFLRLGKSGRYADIIKLSPRMFYMPEAERKNYGTSS